MKRSDNILRPRWLWLLAIAAPLALVGCQGNRTAQGNAPGERVAGERQEEPSAEVRAAMQAAGLPETFVFGGRTWRGHQIHRVEKNEVAMGTQPATANPPGPAGEAGDTAAQPPTGENTFDYTPVADLKIGEHQIYRKAGVDEAFTDNIFLLAEGADASTGTSSSTSDPSTAAPSAGGTASSGETAPGAPAGESATGNAAGGEEQVVFIEYDAAEDQQTLDLTQALQMTGLPQTITVGNKTLTAREVEQYDPDVFDEFKKTADVQGHTAYQGDDKDQVVLMEQATGMGIGETPQPSTGDSASETTPETGTQADMSGPIFIRYEEGDAGATGTTTNP